MVEKIVIGWDGKSQRIYGYRCDRCGNVTRNEPIDGIARCNTCEMQFLAGR